jgi:hypothetical protein
MAYAETTTVPVEKTRAEIERLLTKFKCTQFVVGSDNEKHSAMVQFKAQNRIIRFLVQLPDPEDKKYTHVSAYRRRGAQAAFQAFAQGERQRWRALYLVIKAKLEAVESKIATFEEEFLSHTVLPNDQTVGEVVLPMVEQAYGTGKMPKMLTTTAGPDGAGDPS